MKWLPFPELISLFYFGHLRYNPIAVMNTAIPIPTARVHKNTALGFSQHI